MHTISNNMPYISRIINSHSSFSPKLSLAVILGSILLMFLNFLYLLRFGISKMGFSMYAVFILICIIYLPRRILEWCPPGRRRKGILRNSWMLEVSTGMRERGIGDLVWADREGWRSKINSL